MDNLTRLLHTWSARQDRGVIFDFNGTLSDDEPVLLHVFTELFGEHLGWRMRPDDYLSHLAGHSDREIIERAVVEHGPGDPDLVELMMEQRHRRYLDLVVAEAPIRPGTCALVDRLAACGVPMAVVTGAYRPEVEFVLERSEAGRHLDLVVTEEDVTNGKPDPEGFWKGAELLGLDPAVVLVFEDSVAGIRAARSAGMATIAVEGTAAPRALAAEADAVVPVLGPQLMDAVPGWSAELDSGAQCDAGAVGAKQVERTFHR